MLNIGILISGNGSNLQSIIDKVNDGYINGKITVVISDRPDVYGLERAKLSGIPALSFDRKLISHECLNNEILSALKEYNVQVVVLAGYLTILSSQIIHEYNNAIINVHPSLIPSFCGSGCFGLKVHEKAIEYGVKISGCTVHLVDEGTDTGPIILQKAAPVYDDDTAESLQKRVLKFEHELLPEAVKLMCDGRIDICGRKVKIKGSESHD